MSSWGTAWISKSQMYISNFDRAAKFCFYQYHNTMFAALASFRSTPARYGTHLRTIDTLQIAVRIFTAFMSSTILQFNVKISIRRIRPGSHCLQARLLDPHTRHSAASTHAQVIQTRHCTFQWTLRVPRTACTHPLSNRAPSYQRKQCRAA